MSPEFCAVAEACRKRFHLNQVGKQFPRQLRMSAPMPFDALEETWQNQGAGGAFVLIDDVNSSRNTSWSLS